MPKMGLLQPISTIIHGCSVAKSAFGGYYDTINTF